MVRITAAIRAHRYLALLAGFALFGIMSGAVFGLSRRTRHHQQPNGSIATPTVTNRTNALKVIGVEQATIGSSLILQIKLQNISNKDIKAVTLSAGIGWVTDDRLFSEDVIAPGSTISEIVPLQSNVAEGVNTSPGTSKELAVAAVLFSDGSGDGDAFYVKALTNQYAGIRDQAKSVLKRLRQPPNRVSPERALYELENEASALPTRGTGPVSVDYDDGLKRARAWLLKELTEIKDRRRLNHLVEADRKQEKLKRVYLALAGDPSN
jgi:hypothetical protein